MKGQEERRGHGQETLYLEVAARVAGLISAGTLRPGDRIPSVRGLSRQLRVSVSTVLEAYRRLEDRRMIEARPQSGYYVRCRPAEPPEPEPTLSCGEAAELEVGEQVVRLMREASRPGVLPLGAAVPAAAFFPVRRLAACLARAVRAEPEASQSYGPLGGMVRLQTQIARRLLEAGCTVAPEEVVVTAGAQEAVELCLRAVTQPGDTVAVETPTHHALLQALESLHLRALEIATCPREGLVVAELREALAARRVEACVLVPTFGNPLGHCMPEGRRRELVELLDEHDLPLVEDDVYGELHFGPRRPRAIKAFDRAGRVLLCSSLSKTLAPGWRVGWAVPGRFRRAVQQLKLSSSVMTASPTQLAAAAFLEGGGLDRDLRRLRRTYAGQMERFVAAVAEHFPPGTRATRPAGGHLLWVELPKAIDSFALHRAALSRGVSIVPGPLFSATGRYRNCIRLNCAVPWSPQVAAALQTLGRLAAAAARSGAG